MTRTAGVALRSALAMHGRGQGTCTTQTACHLRFLGAGTVCFRSACMHRLVMGRWQDGYDGWAVPCGVPTRALTCYQDCYQPTHCSRSGSAPACSCVAAACATRSIGSNDGLGCDHIRARTRVVLWPHHDNCCLPLQLACCCFLGRNCRNPTPTCPTARLMTSLPICCDTNSPLCVVCIIAVLATVLL